MLDWTGERFLPWAGGATIAYEHLHRYAYAATLTKSKRVLDLACGEGYGARLLAAEACAVVGIDIDERVVRHARAKYGSSNLEFVCGSITAVPVGKDHSFDVIICFEAIEHIENHEALLEEVKRLLQPHGVFIASTPNKAIYRGGSAEGNPFHVKELYFEEFQALLGRYFGNMRFLGQRIHPASSIWALQGQNGNEFREFVVERSDSGFHVVDPDQRAAEYFIAVASDGEVTPPPASVLLDESDRLFVEKNDELQASIREAAWREKQLADREETIRSMEETLKWQEAKIGELKETAASLTQGIEWLRQRTADLEQTVASHEEGLAWRARQVNELETARQLLERETTTLRLQVQNTRRELAAVTDTLTSIYASRGWKLVLRLRGIRDRIKALLMIRSGTMQ
jgi:ubiquinone/menaquinone biosynthesis C-methylase UbiE